MDILLELRKENDAKRWEKGMKINYLCKLNSALDVSPREEYSSVNFTGKRVRNEMEFLLKHWKECNAKKLRKRSKKK